jgi:hypothetical protein
MRVHAMAFAILCVTAVSCTGSPTVSSTPTRPATIQDVAFRAVGSPPPAGERCPTPPRPDPYAISAQPTAGSSGSTVEVSENTPLINKAGRYLRPNGKIGFWFNLPPEALGHMYVASPPPSTYQGSPVIHLGEASVPGKCSYRVTFHVPNVTPGTYTLVIIEHSHSSGGYAQLGEPIYFRVTM